MIRFTITQLQQFLFFTAWIWPAGVLFSGGASADSKDVGPAMFWGFVWLFCGIRLFAKKAWPFRAKPERASDAVSSLAHSEMTAHEDVRRQQPSAIPVRPSSNDNPTVGHRPDVPASRAYHDSQNASTQSSLDESQLTFNEGLKIRKIAAFVSNTITREFTRSKFDALWTRITSRSDPFRGEWTKEDAASRWFALGFIRLVACAERQWTNIFPSEDHGDTAIHLAQSMMTSQWGLSDRERTKLGTFLKESYPDAPGSLPSFDTEGSFLEWFERYGYRICGENPPWDVTQGFRGCGDIADLDMDDPSFHFAMACSSAQDPCRHSWMNLINLDDKVADIASEFRRLEGYGKACGDWVAKSFNAALHDYLYERESLRPGWSMEDSLGVWYSMADFCLSVSLSSFDGAIPKTAISILYTAGLQAMLAAWNMPEAAKSQFAKFYSTMRDPALVYWFSLFSEKNSFGDWGEVIKPGWMSAVRVMEEAARGEGSIDDLKQAMQQAASSITPPLAVQDTFFDLFSLAMRGCDIAFADSPSDSFKARNSVLNAFPGNDYLYCLRSHEMPFLSGYALIRDVIGDRERRRAIITACLMIGDSEAMKFV